MIGSGKIRGALLLIVASLFLCDHPGPLCAQEVRAPFAYTWKIVLGQREIGRAVSHFVPGADGPGPSLAETGRREFTAGFGPFIIHFREETEVVWDGSGLMTSFVSHGGVNGGLEERTALRDTDGAVTWKRIKNGTSDEKRFRPDDFDYTDADRFLTRLLDADKPKSLRILSLSKGRIYRMTYRFAGWETAAIGGGTIRAARMETDGPGGEGFLLIDDLGIAVSLTIQSLFGDFSFVPCDPGEIPAGFDPIERSGR